MKVFLSWSGHRSRAVAEALRDWLPDVLQVIQPWLSGVAIPLGARWASEIAGILKEPADAGIICLTRDEVHHEWLNFDAGALSETVKPRLCVYALDLDPAEISGPLAGLQSAQADNESTLRLVRTLNDLAGDSQVPPELLERMFQLRWPLLEERLKSIPGSRGFDKRGRSSTVEYKIDEALKLLRLLCKTSKPVRQNKNTVRDEARVRSRVFIGSSTEGLEIAQAIQEGLEQYAECRIWNQGIFKPAATTIESIVNVAVEVDFAIIVLTADDVVVKRGKKCLGPRDNMIFELGLFTGALGRARTFMVISRDDQPILPTDVAGVTVAMYSRPGGNAVAALGPVCTQIKRAMGILVPGN